MNWSESRGAFERTVEALIQRMWSTRTDGVAYAIDGRGGDGGLDIFVSENGNPDEPIHVYQLKFFPEGMSSGFKKRREQVKSSFLSVADKPSLKRWTLVIPGNPTVPELKSVHALRSDRTIQLDIMGQSQLDEAIAKYPDLLNWATREPLIDVLRMASMESAALSSGSDLAQRLDGLGKIADGRSAYWGSSFGYQDGVVTETLHAKRPDAAEREPLSFEFSAEFGDADAELHHQFQSMLDYGSATPVSLPETVVKNLEFKGPDWFAQTGGQATVEIHPLKLDAPVEVELLVLDDDEVVLSTLSGSLTLISSGRVGETLRAEFKGLTLTLQRGGGAVGVTMTYELSELTGSEASRLFKLIALVATGGRWRIERDGQSVISLHGLQDAPEAEELVPATWVDLASDLAVIERELDLAFKMPDDISNLDRVNLKVARMLLEGKVTCTPSVEVFTAVVTGELTESDLDDLAEPRAMMKSGPFAPTVLGKKVRLGELRAYHPNMKLVDVEELHVALTTGAALGRRVVIKPQDDTPIRIWLEGKLSSEARVIPERWNIPDIEELPGLEKAIRAAADAEQAQRQEDIDKPAGA